MFAWMSCNFYMKRINANRINTTHNYKAIAIMNTFPLHITLLIALEGWNQLKF